MLLIILVQKRVRLSLAQMYGSKAPAKHPEGRRNPPQRYKICGYLIIFSTVNCFLEILPKALLRNTCISSVYERRSDHVGSLLYLQVLEKKRQYWAQVWIPNLGPTQPASQQETPGFAFVPHFRGACSAQCRLHPQRRSQQMGFSLFLKRKTDFL